LLLSRDVPPRAVPVCHGCFPQDSSKPCTMPASWF